MPPNYELRADGNAFWDVNTFRVLRFQGKDYRVVLAEIEPENLQENIKEIDDYSAEITVKDPNKII